MAPKDQTTPIRDAATGHDGIGPSHHLLHPSPLSEIIQVHAGESHVTVEDTHLLLSADYARHGDDLVLSGKDGHEVVLRGYFGTDHAPDLIGSNGATIHSTLAAKLAGPVAPGQYAAAGGDGLGPAVGKADVVKGEITVIHADGTKSVLHQGDAIHQNDQIISGEGASVGMTLGDGSTLSIGQNSRMVIDDLVYDPSAKTGEGQVDLVAGTATFVSGQISKASPDAFSIKTPMTVVGIRGTAGGISVAQDGATLAALLAEKGFTGEITVGGTVVNTPNTASIVTTPGGSGSSPAAFSPQEFGSTFGSALSSLPNASGHIDSTTLNQAIDSFHQQQQQQQQQQQNNNNNNQPHTQATPEQIHAEAVAVAQAVTAAVNAAAAKTIQALQAEIAAAAQAEAATVEQVSLLANHAAADAASTLAAAYLSESQLEAQAVATLQAEIGSAATQNSTVNLTGESHAIDTLASSANPNLALATLNADYATAASLSQQAETNVHSVLLTASEYPTAVVVTTNLQGDTVTLSVAELTASASLLAATVQQEAAQIHADLLGAQALEADTLNGSTVSVSALTTALSTVISDSSLVILDQGIVTSDQHTLADDVNALTATRNNPLGTGQSILSLLTTDVENQASMQTYLGALVGAQNQYADAVLAKAAWDFMAATTDYSLAVNTYTVAGTVDGTSATSTYTLTTSHTDLGSVTLQTVVTDLNTAVSAGSNDLSQAITDAAAAKASALTGLTEAIDQYNLLNPTATIAVTTQAASHSTDDAINSWYQAWNIASLTLETVTEANGGDAATVQAAQLVAQNNLSVGSDTTTGLATYYAQLASVLNNQIDSGNANNLFGAYTTALESYLNFHTGSLATAEGYVSAAETLVSNDLTTVLGDIATQGTAQNTQAQDVGTLMVTEAGLQAQAANYAATVTLLGNSASALVANAQEHVGDAASLYAAYIAITNPTGSQTTTFDNAVAADVTAINADTLALGNLSASAAAEEALISSMALSVGSLTTVASNASGTLSQAVINSVEQLLSSLHGSDSTALQTITSITQALDQANNDDSVATIYDPHPQAVVDSYLVSAYAAQISASAGGVTSLADSNTQAHDTAVQANSLANSAQTALVSAESLFLANDTTLNTAAVESLHLATTGVQAELTSVTTNVAAVQADFQKVAADLAEVASDVANSNAASQALATAVSEMASVTTAASSLPDETAFNNLNAADQAATTALANNLAAEAQSYAVQASIDNAAANSYNLQAQSAASAAVTDAIAAASAALSAASAAIHGDFTTAQSGSGSIATELGTVASALGDMYNFNSSFSVDYTHFLSASSTIQSTASVLDSLNTDAQAELAAAQAIASALGNLGGAAAAAANWAQTVVQSLALSAASVSSDASYAGDTANTTNPSGAYGTVFNDGVIASALDGAYGNYTAATSAAAAAAATAEAAVSAALAQDATAYAASQAAAVASVSSDLADAEQWAGVTITNGTLTASSENANNARSALAQVEADYNSGNFTAVASDLASVQADVGSVSLDFTDGASAALGYQAAFANVPSIALVLNTAEGYGGQAQALANAALNVVNAANDWTNGAAITNMTLANAGIASANSQVQSALTTEGTLATAASTAQGNLPQYLEAQAGAAASESSLQTSLESAMIAFLQSAGNNTVQTDVASITAGSGNALTELITAVNAYTGTSVALGSGATQMAADQQTLANLDAAIQTQWDNSPGNAIAAAWKTGYDATFKSFEAAYSNVLSDNSALASAQSLADTAQSQALAAQTAYIAAEQSDASANAALAQAQTALTVDEQTAAKLVQSALGTALSTASTALADATHQASLALQDAANASSIAISAGATSAAIQAEVNDIAVRLADVNTDISQANSALATYAGTNSISAALLPSGSIPTNLTGAESAALSSALAAASSALAQAEGTFSLIGNIDTQVSSSLTAVNNATSQANTALADFSDQSLLLGLAQTAASNADAAADAALANAQTNSTALASALGTEHTNATNYNTTVTDAAFSENATILGTASLTGLSAAIAAVNPIISSNEVGANLTSAQLSAFTAAFNQSLTALSTALTSDTAALNTDYSKVTSAALAADSDYSTAHNTSLVSTAATAALDAATQANIASNYANSLSVLESSLSLNSSLGDLAQRVADWTEAAAQYQTAALDQQSAQTAVGTAVTGNTATILGASYTANADATSIASTYNAFSSNTLAQQGDSTTYGQLQGAENQAQQALTALSQAVSAALSASASLASQETLALVDYAATAILAQNANALATNQAEQEAAAAAQAVAGYLSTIQGYTGAGSVIATDLSAIVTAYNSIAGDSAKLAAAATLEGYEQAAVSLANQASSAAGNAALYATDVQVDAQTILGSDNPGAASTTQLKSDYSAATGDYVLTTNALNSLNTLLTEAKAVTGNSAAQTSIVAQISAALTSASNALTQALSADSAAISYYDNVSVAINSASLLAGTIAAYVTSTGAATVLQHDITSQYTQGISAFNTASASLSAIAASSNATLESYFLQASSALSSALQASTALANAHSAGAQDITNIQTDATTAGAPNASAYTIETEYNLATTSAADLTTQDQIAKLENQALLAAETIAINLGSLITQYGSQASLQTQATNAATLSLTEHDISVALQGYTASVTVNESGLVGGTGALTPSHITITPTASSAVSDPGISNVTVNVVSVNGASHGTVALVNGNIVYTPNAFFYGTDTIVFTEQETASITVSGTNSLGSVITTTALYQTEATDTMTVSVAWQEQQSSMLPVTLSYQPNQVVQLSSAAIAAAYQSPDGSSLYEVRITQLPPSNEGTLYMGGTLTNGTLTGGTALTSANNPALTAAQLGSLYFQAASGYTGAESFVIESLDAVTIGGVLTPGSIWSAASTVSLQVAMQSNVAIATAGATTATGTVTATDITSYAPTFTATASDGTVKFAAVVNGASTSNSHTYSDSFTYTANSTALSGASLTTSSTSNSATVSASVTDTVTFVTSDGAGHNSTTTTTQVTLTDSLKDVAAGGNATAHTPVTESFTVTDGAGVSTTATITAQNGTVTMGTGTAAGTYVYTANSGFLGVDTLTLHVSDALGLTETSTIQVSVTDAITATFSKVSGSLSAGYAGTYTTTDAAGYLVSATATAAHGSVSLGANGTYTYTAYNSGFVGTDTITFTFNDGTVAGQTTTATALVTVSDTLTNTVSGGTVGAQVAITGTVSTTDSAGLSVTKSYSAGHGTVVAGPSGTYVYTSSSGFVGTDTVTVTATDSHGLVTTSTAFVTVTDHFSATAASTSGMLGTLITGTYNAVEGAGLAVTPAATAAHGSVSFGPNGTYTYFANSGFIGTDTITFAFNDGPSTVSATAHVTVTDNLSATAFSTVGTYGAGIQGSYATNDLAGLAVTATATAAHGTVAMGPNDTYTYTAQSNFIGTDTITFTYKDGTGGATVTSTASVVVNDHLTAAPTSVSGTYGQAITGALNATDAAHMTVTGTGSGMVPGSSVVVNANGTYTYTAASGFVGTDTILFTLSDGTGGQTLTTSALVTVNDKFTESLSTGGAIVSGGSFTGTYTASDSSGLTATPSFTALHGSVTVGPNDTYIYTANSGFSGTDTIVMSVTDGIAGQTSSLVETTVTVGLFNYSQPSVITLSANLNGATINGSGNDTFVLTATPPSGTITINESGTHSIINASQVLSGEFVGAYQSGNNAVMLFANGGEIILDNQFSTATPGGVGYLFTENGNGSAGQTTLIGETSSTQATLSTTASNAILLANLGVSTVILGGSHDQAFLGGGSQIVYGDGVFDSSGNNFLGGDVNYSEAAPQGGSASIVYNEVAPTHVNSSGTDATKISVASFADGSYEDIWYNPLTNDLMGQYYTSSNAPLGSSMVLSALGSLSITNGLKVANTATGFDMVWGVSGALLVQGETYTTGSPTFSPTGLVTVTGVNSPFAAAVTSVGTAGLDLIWATTTNGSTSVYVENISSTASGTLSASSLTAAYTLQGSLTISSDSVADLTGATTILAIADSAGNADILVGAAGSAYQAVPLIALTGVTSVHVADLSATSFALAWETEGSNGLTTIETAIYNTSGALASSGSVTIQTNVEGSVALQMSTSSSSGYAVDWLSPGAAGTDTLKADIFTTANPNGTIVTLATGLATTDTIGLIRSMSDGSFIFTWADAWGDAYTERVSATGTPEALQVIAGNGSATLERAVSFSDGSYEAIWYNAAANDFMGEHFGSTGNALSGPVVIDALSGSTISQVKVTNYSGGYAMAWEQYSAATGAWDIVVESQTYSTSAGTLSAATFETLSVTSLPTQIGLTALANGSLAIMWDANTSNEATSQTIGSVFMETLSPSALSGTVTAVSTATFTDQTEAVSSLAQAALTGNTMAVGISDSYGNGTITIGTLGTSFHSTDVIQLQDATNLRLTGLGNSNSFAAAWENVQDASISLETAVYTNVGATIGNGMWIQTGDTTYSPFSYQINGTTGGGFAVAWLGSNGTGQQTLEAEFFNPQGNTFNNDGAPVTLATGLSSSASLGNIRSLSNGSEVFTWTDGNGNAYTEIFDAQGDPIGGVTLTTSSGSSTATYTDTLVNVDTITGTTGNDTFNLAAGNGSVRGSNGNDLYNGQVGNAWTVSYENFGGTVSINLAADTVVKTGSGSISLGTDTLINVNSVQGSSGADVITGGIISGATYNLDGGGGNDTFNGGTASGVTNNFIIDPNASLVIVNGDHNGTNTLEFGDYVANTTTSYTLYGASQSISNIDTIGLYNQQAVNSLNLDAAAALALVNHNDFNDGIYTLTVQGNAGETLHLNGTWYDYGTLNNQNAVEYVSVYDGNTIAVLMSEQMTAGFTAQGAPPYTFTTSNESAQLGVNSGYEAAVLPASTTSFSLDGHDTVFLSAASLALDTLTFSLGSGGTATNTISLVDTSANITDAAFAHMAGVSTLQAGEQSYNGNNSNSPETITLGANAQAAGINTVLLGDQSVTIDASQFTGSLTIHGGSEGDTFIVNPNTLTESAPNPLSTTSSEWNSSATYGNGTITTLSANQVALSYAVQDYNTGTPGNPGAYSEEDNIEFNTTAQASGTIVLQFSYTGDHAWASAYEGFNIYDNGIELSQPVNQTTSSGNFSYTGSITLTVTQGDQLTFQLYGGNFDYSDFLDGTLTLTNESAGGNPIIVGGEDGNNTVELTETGSIADAVFAGIQNVQTLVIEHASSVILGQNAQETGIDYIDLSHDSVTTATINLTSFNLQNDVIVSATANNTIIGGTNGLTTLEFDNSTSSSYSLSGHAFTNIDAVTLYGPVTTLTVDANTVLTEGVTSSSVVSGQEPGLTASMSVYGEVGSTVNLTGLWVDMGSIGSMTLYEGAGSTSLAGDAAFLAIQQGIVANVGTIAHAAVAVTGVTAEVGQAQFTLGETSSNYGSNVVPVFISGLTADQQISVDGQMYVANNSGIVTVDALGLADISFSQAGTHTITLAAGAAAVTEVLTVLPELGAAAMQESSPVAASNAAAPTDLSVQSTYGVGASDTYVLSVSADHGSLTLGGTTAATIAVTGSLSTIDSDLNALTYSSNSGFDGTDTLHSTLQDITAGNTGPSITQSFAETVNAPITSTATQVVQEKGSVAGIASGASSVLLWNGTTTGTTAHGGVLSITGDTYTYTAASGFTGVDDFILDVTQGNVVATEDVSVDVVSPWAALDLTSNEQPPSGIALAFYNNGYSTLNAGTNILTGEGAFTVSGWFETGNSGNQILLSLGSSANYGSGQGAAVYMVDGDLRFCGYGMGSVSTSSTVDDGNWHYMTATYTGSQANGTAVLSLYLDGKLAGTETYSGSEYLNLTSGSVTIGGSDFGTNTSGWTNFIGELSNVGIWNVQLTQAQILANMESGGNIPAVTLGLAAYLPLNEGTGIVLNDISGNGHDSTTSYSDWAGGGPPVTSAQNNTIFAAENTTFSDHLTSTDAYGNALTWTLGSISAAHGTETLVDGVLSFAPTAYWHGTDSFTLDVTDSALGLTSVETIAVSVASAIEVPGLTKLGNEAPEQTVAVNGTTSISGQIVASENDDTGSIATVSVIGATEVGSTSTYLTADGTLTFNSTNFDYTYQANSGFAGEDSFTLSFNDAHGGPATTETFYVDVVGIPGLSGLPSVAVGNSEVLNLTPAEVLSPVGVTVTATIQSEYGGLSVGMSVDTMGISASFTQGTVGTVDNTLTLIGTYQDVERALADIVYAPEASGTANTNTDTISVNIIGLSQTVSTSGTVVINQQVAPVEATAEGGSQFAGNDYAYVNSYSENTNQYIPIATQTSDLTFQALVNWNGSVSAASAAVSAGSYIFFNGDLGSDGFGLKVTSNGHLEVEIVDSTGHLTDYQAVGVTLAANQLTNLAMVVGSTGAVSIVLNGVTYSSFTNTSTNAAATPNISVIDPTYSFNGGDTTVGNAMMSFNPFTQANDTESGFSPYGFEGTILNAALWNEALTSSQIAANMLAVNPNNPNLIAFWPFTAATYYSGDGNTISDISGNENGLQTSNLTQNNVIGNGIVAIDGVAASVLMGAENPLGTGVTWGLHGITPASGISTDVLTGFGTVVLNDATGVLTFTPSTGIMGVESLVITATDTNGTSSETFQLVAATDSLAAESTITGTFVLGGGTQVLSTTDITGGGTLFNYASDLEVSSSDGVSIIDPNFVNVGNVTFGEQTTTKFGANFTNSGSVTLGTNDGGTVFISGNLENTGTISDSYNRDSSTSVIDAVNIDNRGTINVGIAIELGFVGMFTNEGTIWLGDYPNSSTDLYMGAIRVGGILSNSQSTGDGDVVNTGTILANSQDNIYLYNADIINNGTIQVDGTLNINSSGQSLGDVYLGVNSDLNIHASGGSALDMQGTLTLGGTLNILQDSAPSSTGIASTLINADVITGSFETITGLYDPTVVQALIDIQFLNNSVTLQDESVSQIATATSATLSGQYLIAGVNGDTLDGSGYSHDVLIGQQGNDNLIVSNTNFDYLNGGGGFNTLVWNPDLATNPSGTTFDLQSVMAGLVENIQEIDLSRLTGATLNIDAANVQAMAQGTTNAGFAAAGVTLPGSVAGDSVIMVYSNVNETVNLTDNGWTALSGTVGLHVNGQAESYTVYTNTSQHVAVLVDTNITHVNHS